MQNRTNKVKLGYQKKKKKTIGIGSLIKYLTLMILTLILAKVVTLVLNKWYYGN